MNTLALSRLLTTLASLRKEFAIIIAKDLLDSELHS